MSKTNRFLTIYSGVLTLVFSTVMLTSGGGIRQQKLDVLDVQRINIREADGTLRAVISNRAMLPGIVIKGKEYAHQRDQAGMLFYNDEGTENGGIGFGGSKGTSDGSLSFDSYQQDQIVTIFGTTQGSRSVAGMALADRPARNIATDIQEMEKLASMPEDKRNALLQQRVESGYYGQQRMFVGKQDDGSTAVDLRDKNGKTRLRLSVSAEGKAVIEFLDANGKVTKSVAP